MADLTVIFRTHSDVEASIVRGLLESHGVPTVVRSDLPHSIFPVAINGLGEVRISVHPEDADEGRRIIESHRTEMPNSRVVARTLDATSLPVMREMFRSWVANPCKASPVSPVRVCRSEMAVPTSCAEFGT